MARTKVIGFKGLLRTQCVETHMSVKSCSNVGIIKWMTLLPYLDSWYGHKNRKINVELF